MWRFFFTIVGLFFVGTVLAGEGSLQTPKQLEGIEVLDKVGTHVPLDVRLTDENGATQTLGEIVGNSKVPTILTLGYFKCKMLCGLVQNSLASVVKELSFTLGKDYQIVSVSIAPSDTVAIASAKRSNYLESLGDKGSSGAWHFFVTDDENAKKLAAAVGFQYRYVPRDDDYAHGAAIFILSPQGLLSRTLWGIEYKSSDVKMGIMEASQGKVGTTLERILLSCFHYDPDSHRYGVYIFGVMRLGGVLTIIGVSLMLLLYWRGERKRLKVVS